MEPEQREHTMMNLTEDRLATYDPMVYDIMRETTNQLRGVYLARADAAANQPEEAAWLDSERTLLADARTVDVFDEQAVRTFTAKIESQLAQLAS